MTRSDELPWRALPDGVGTALAVAGRVVAAADGGFLRIWRGGVRVAELAAATWTPGRPTIGPGWVRWGPLEVDLGTETPQAAIAEQAGPPEGYLATAYGWSPDGVRLVGAGRRIAATGPPDPSIVWVYDADRGERRLLWEGVDVPPVAVAAGEVIVIGHREPTVLDANGRLLAVLPGITSPLRVDVADLAPGLVLVVEAARLAVFTTGGELIGERSGLFVDAALAPWGDGLVLAAGFDGELTAYALGRGLPDRHRWLDDDRITAIAADADGLLASFGAPPGLRLARRPP